MLALWNVPPCCDRGPSWPSRVELSAILEPRHERRAPSGSVQLLDPTLEEDELNAIWECAVKAVRSHCLPIKFHDVAKGELQALIAGLVGDSVGFYFGATVDPCWRWLGGNSDRGGGGQCRATYTMAGIGYTCSILGRAPRQRR